MLTILTAVFLIGWVAAAVIGTQAYFRGEQTKPIHARNWRSESFEQIAKSVTVKMLIAIAFQVLPLMLIPAKTLPTA